MSSVVRVALVWLLAIALPLQGAAAAMRCCGSHHQGGAEASGLHRHAHAEPAHSHAEHDAIGPSGASPVHHHDAVAEDVSAAVGQPDASSAESPTDIDTADAGPAGKCSACAACCTAALPTASLTIAAPTFEADGEARVPPHAVVFTTDGPERPPRTSLD